MTKRIVLVLSALITLCVGALAQTSTQQAPSDLQSPVLVQNFSTAAAQGTITITPPAGQFVYIVELDGQACNGTNTTVTTGFYTTTGLGGNPKWATQASATAQACGVGFTFNPSHPLKSATSGTNVTIVTPASLTAATWNLNAFYYFAP